ncbi:5709_t:CDS:2 [Diversispora eburnea]|uniref:5709_t:CDS:1 n=1 Tax=Diversispora eburnea TaxID=1213867 RepID=A0A9N8VXX5_9GLOM|nr:5709_t:CDS:2 [Diversispora eburnea]
MVNEQHIAIVPEFTLISGHTLHKVPVAYKTWGSLNHNKDNVMVICHALSGSADVADWWGPLIGKGRAFDPTKFFIFCGNTLGSPYGSASPITINPDTGLIYGPEFPLTTPRDDVRLHKIILDNMGIKQVAICIGGSMGGMQVLEWAFFGQEYVKTIAPIATSARFSAWGISWNEAQRQSIYCDNKYCNGFYTDDETPDTGLAAARMSALLTYRSRDSFESRFGRKLQDPKKLSDVNNNNHFKVLTPAETALLIHNEGHKKWALNNNRHLTAAVPHTFSAQSYLRYQGDKFVKRFDANCYISLTRKMDSHDISKGRKGDIVDILRSIKQPTCVFGIESDGLFTISEQYELAEHIPNSKMITIHSPDGHDGFLLEFDQINRHLLKFIRKQLSDIIISEEIINIETTFQVTKDSVFGEAEVDDVMKW